MQRPFSVKPDFNNLMAVYEQNYRQLNRLLDRELLEKNQYLTSKINNDSPQLFIDVIERHKFTTILRLTYLFNDSELLWAEPNCYLRIYYDAKMVEATYCEPGRNLRSWALKNQRLPIIDCIDHATKKRWQINHFLDKWLALLIYQGHNQSTLQAVDIDIAQRLSNANLMTS